MVLKRAAQAVCAVMALPIGAHYQDNGYLVVGAIHIVLGACVVGILAVRAVDADENEAHGR